MFDARVRLALAPALDRAAAGLDRAGVSALSLTGAGFAAGVAACAAAATSHWGAAVLLWLLNRLLDGLDGPVARRRGATELGGFLDIVADFTIYGGFVIAVGLARPDARLACLVLLGAYYVSGTAFLALSSILERRGNRFEDLGVARDGRSLRFVAGLAEGTETVIVYVLIALLPAHAALIAWTFAAMVAITAMQRVTLGIRLFRSTAHQPTTDVSDRHSRVSIPPTSS